MITVANPNWSTSEPQFYVDSWRNKVRRLDYVGRCIECGRRTYAFEDGQNDPRGVLEDRAASPLHASDYDSIGPTVPMCFMCANDEDRYTHGLSTARGLWAVEVKKASR